MQKRWFLKTPQDRTTVETFRSSLKVDAVVAELLLQRGISDFDTAEQFFRPKLDQLHDPYLMADMETAVERLNQALENDEHILLYGDYDVDGTTAVALLHSILSEHSDHLNYYIPDRYSEGYGLSEQGVDFAIEKKVKLMITLDCGIKANDHVSRLKEHGIDVIICDHHRPGEELPDAIVLDPKREDCKYPYDELSGCGVGFKLLQALFIKQSWDSSILFENLDLLAVSIGADIVPITGENRILCFHGMEKLNEEPRSAFQEMLSLSKKSFPITLTDVVFSIAPRINAAGRLRSGRYAVELMISQDLDEIRQLAIEINADNQERKLLDQQITEEALGLLEKQDENRCSNVVFDKDWHKGVVGIVASRIMETHYKPTIVLTESEGMVTGSARSVKGFDIHRAISECSTLLDRFGGHMYAAGLTLERENLPAFMKQFEETVCDSIDRELLIEELEIDMELNFDQIFGSEENRMKIPKLKRILRQFEPHGPDNMKPVFLSRNVFSTDVRVLKDIHLKLSMTQPHCDIIIDGIGFKLGHKQDEVAAGLPFDVAYTLEINRWNGRKTLQLNIRDIRPTV